MSRAQEEKTVIPPYFQTNTIYCGDCLDVMKKFPDECVDLIYLDPPFFSNKNYEVIWGDGYELRAFQDRWKGGVENYIAWMRPRLQQCYRVLKKTGSIYLHCDWHANAHLRILMDDIFGESNFMAEIIWHYHTGGVSKRNWGTKHDTIFFYVKDRKSPYTFNLIKEKRYYERPFFGATEGYKRDEQGRLYILAHPDDVWEIPGVLNVSKQFLGYPTQKPEALLEKIITASSNPLDIVLDPFCGCGTAIAAAHKLGRRWVGIDVSPTACNVMQRRMSDLRAQVNLVGMPMTEDELKKIQPFDFQNWVVQRLFGRVSSKKSSDLGIDGYTMEGYPIQVKQSEGVGRNVVDNFETAMRRNGANTGIIVAFSFGKGAYEEAARAKNKENMDIRLITVSELLKNEQKTD